MPKNENNPQKKEIKISNQKDSGLVNPESTDEIFKDMKGLHEKIYASPKVDSPKMASPEMGFKGFNTGSSSMSQPPSPPSVFGAESGKSPESQIIHQAPKPNVHLWLYLASSIFVLLSVIVGISLYKGDIYWVRDLFGLGLPNDPVKAIEKVNKNMGKVKAYKSDVEAKLNFNIDQDKLSGKLIGESETDKTKEETKLNFKFKDVSIPEMPGGTKTDIKEIEKSLEFSMISTKNELYFKTPLLENKWQKINLTNLIVPNKLSSKNEGDIRKEVPQLLGAVMYSDGTQKTGLEELSKHVKSAKKMNDEKVKGESNYHYSYEIDFMKTLEEDESYKKMPDFQKEVLKNLISKYITLKADSWVSKKSLLFTKEKINLDIKINGEDFGQSGIFKFNVELSEEYKDINKSVTIEKPSDAVDFDPNKFINSFSFGGSKVLPEDSKANVNDTKRKADLKQIQTALEAYAEDNKGAYPALADDSKKGSFLAILVPNYLPKVPIDPSHPNYYYKYESDGKKYKLTCVLENPNDTTGKKSGNLNIYTIEGP